MTQAHAKKGRQPVFKSVRRAPGRSFSDVAAYAGAHYSLARRKAATARATGKRGSRGGARGKVSARPKASITAEIAQARRLGVAFSGVDPRSSRRVPAPAPANVALAIGPLLGIIYTATRDGEIKDYLHRFKKSSRPLLCATADGSKLLIVGGRYRFTARGIEDF